MRLTQLGLTVLIAGLILLLKGSSPLVAAGATKTQKNALGQATDPQSIRDAPPGYQPLWRPAASWGLRSKAYTTDSARSRRFYCGHCREQHRSQPHEHRYI